MLICLFVSFVRSFLFESEFEIDVEQNFSFVEMSLAGLLLSQPTDQQQPPAYILQSWRREQPTRRDEILLEKTFLIAPDTSLPFSRLRQKIRKVYEDRARPVVVIHYDPWAKEAINARRAQTAAVSLSNKDQQTNVGLERSNTIL